MGKAGVVEQPHHLDVMPSTAAVWRCYREAKFLSQAPAVEVKVMFEEKYGIRFLFEEPEGERCGSFEYDRNGRHLRVFEAFQKFGYHPNGVWVNGRVKARTIVSERLSSLALPKVRVVCPSDDLKLWLLLGPDKYFSNGGVWPQVPAAPSDWGTVVAERDGTFGSFSADVPAVGGDVSLPWDIPLYGATSGVNF